MDRFDRRADDVANILSLDHLNVQVPDQGLATIFYVLGLGLTRDPYMMVGIDNMWANVGRQQFHLLTRSAQVVNGRTGLVIQDIDALCRRLEFVAPQLKDTHFGYSHKDGVVEVTCPWGNLFVCHAPGPQFGRMTLGMPYIEFDVLPGTASAIATFYRELIGARTEVISQPDGECALIACGVDQALRFRETRKQIPAYDGYHIQITLADFSGTHDRLEALGLISEESNVHQYRFVRIVDPASGRELACVEHEVRSVLHPMYARPLVNRNPAQSVAHYTLGADAWVPNGPPIKLGSKKVIAPPS